MRIDPFSYVPSYATEAHQECQRFTAALEGGIGIIALADADDQQLAMMNIAPTAA